MLMLLPLAALGILLLILLGEIEPEEDWTQDVVGSFIRAAVLWGAFVAVSSESLSLLKGLTQIGLSLAWLSAVLASVTFGWRRGSLQRGFERLRAVPVRVTKTEGALLTGIVGVAGILILVGWIAPANNVDAFLYHMARVVHWAQDHDLRHYATARDHQLLKPIWAETAILHLRTLWGNDRPAYLVQWFSMVGSIVGVIGLAARLGAGRTGRFLAAAFVVSIPLGILQATTAQNDYVVAFWAVTAAYLVVHSARATPVVLDRVCLALTLGIGFLTKGTFYVYAPLFIVWYFLVRWRQSGFRKVMVEGVAMALLAGALNLGFWVRNVETFGGPYGSSDWLQKNLWIQLKPAPADPTIPVQPMPAPADPTIPVQPMPTATGVTDPVVGILGRELRTAAFNLVTPVAKLNEITLTLLSRAPSVFNEEYLNDWRIVAWNHEDTAPSPLHFVLILGSSVLALLSWRGNDHAPVRWYTLSVLGCFLLIPVVIGHGSGVWGIRYQLPFFVLGGAVVASLASRPWIRKFMTPAAGLLVLTTIPYLAYNNTRPLIGRTPWPTRIGSVLATSPTDILFAMNPRLRPSYVDGVTLVRESGCSQVGLRIDSDDLEYTFWWLLQAPQSGVRIETINTVDRLKYLVNPTFHPCAILCTICTDRQRLHGLPLAADLDRVEVFIGPGFVADPDG